MSIQIGEKIPSISLQVMAAEGPKKVTTDELFNGKKVVLMAVPGAFTPGCSMTHLPGFVVKIDEIKAKGVDEVICTSVNDVFVMHAWGKNQNAEHLTMLADGNGALATALGLTMDASGFEMGPVRSQRYAMIVNDGVVELLNVDTKGIDKSSAETILAAL
jgi:glutaredoxin/glutathione-dependent peroxiredoxin